MRLRYNAAMPRRQSCFAHPPLPGIWLLSDARNDAVLEQVLAALPPGSGVVFRHYHLESDARRARFARVKAAADAQGHAVVLSGDAALAVQWEATGVYGPPARLGPQGRLLRLATAHDAAGIVAANDAGVDGVFLSPVFPTQSHPGAPALGAEEFRRLAGTSQVPVIALGGMNAARAAALRWPRWAAIDGLSHPAMPAAG